MNNTERVAKYVKKHGGEWLAIKDVARGLGMTYGTAVDALRKASSDTSMGLVYKWQTVKRGQTIRMYRYNPYGLACRPFGNATKPIDGVEK